MFCKANSHTTLQHASAADCCDCCDRHGGADAFFLIDQSPVSSDTSARARKIAMEEVVRQIGWKKIDCSSDGPLIQISYTHNKRMSSQVSRDVCNMEPMRCNYWKLHMHLSFVYKVRQLRCTKNKREAATCVCRIFSRQASVFPIAALGLPQKPSFELADYRCPSSATSWPNGYFGNAPTSPFVAGPKGVCKCPESMIWSQNSHLAHASNGERPHESSEMSMRIPEKTLAEIKKTEAGLLI